MVSTNPCPRCRNRHGVRTMSKAKEKVYLKRVTKPAAKTDAEAALRSLATRPITPDVIENLRRITDGAERLLKALGHWPMSSSIRKKQTEQVRVAKEAFICARAAKASWEKGNFNHAILHAMSASEHYGMMFMVAAAEERLNNLEGKNAKWRADLVADVEAIKKAVNTLRERDGREPSVSAVREWLFKNKILSLAKGSFSNRISEARAAGLLPEVGWRD